MKRGFFLAAGPDGDTLGVLISKRNRPLSELSYSKGL